MKITAICVYCGSSPGLRPEFAHVASAFGQLLASNNVTLVYGGGNVGLMGAVADGALAMGGRVIGVTWTQLGIHRKPCAFLNVAGFYNPLIAFIHP